MRSPHRDVQSTQSWMEPALALMSLHCWPLMAIGFHLNPWSLDSRADLLYFLSVTTHDITECA